MCVLYKGFLLGPLLASTILCQMVRAEPESPKITDSEVISTSAIDLKVPARGGVGYTTDGAAAEASAIGAQELAINNNTIQNNGGAGIRATARDLGVQEFVTDAASNSQGISNNTIAKQSVVFNTSDFATQVADISTNSISNNNKVRVGPDLIIAATDVNSSVCIVARNNTVPVGIEFSSKTLVIPGIVNLQAFFQVGDRDNGSANNNGVPVALINRGTGLEDPSIFEDFTLSAYFP